MPTGKPCAPCAARAARARTAATAAAAAPAVVSKTEFSRTKPLVLNDDGDLVQLQWLANGSPTGWGWPAEAASIGRGSTFWAKISEGSLDRFARLMRRV